MTVDEEVAEWRRLLDPVVLHTSLLMGKPVRLSREALLHIAGVDASVLKDAERYRKLREQGSCHSKDSAGVVIGDQLKAKVSFRYWTSPEELDRLVDSLPTADSQG